MNCPVPAAAFLASASAIAADLALRAAASICYNWSGCYLGANGGGAWDSVNFTIGNNDTAFFGPAFARGATRAATARVRMAAATQAGCIWQPTAAAYVIGPAAHADWTKLKNSKSINTNVARFASGTGTGRDTMQSITTIRGRVGFAFCPFVVREQAGDRSPSPPLRMRPIISIRFPDQRGGRPATKLHSMTCCKKS